jgi:hypothetical protein
MRDWETKLQNGEFISKWNGYTPHYAGCFYGSSIVLGGEDKYKHCYDFLSGICDVDWWIKAELDKLTPEEQEELLYFIKRNEAFDNYKNTIVPLLVKTLNVEPYQIYRIPNKILYDLLKMIHFNANKPGENPYWML